MILSDSRVQRKLVPLHVGPRQVRDHLGRWVPVMLLIAAVLWSYRPTILDLFTAWQSDADYSAGMIVPLLAVYLIWWERRRFSECQPVPWWWAGAGMLILAEAVRCFGLWLMRPSLERFALVFVVAGIVLVTAGRQVFRRVAWIWLFLFLMVPLPSFVHNRISAPLQSVATTGAVLLLEAFGTSVSQQGNVVMLNGDTPLAVAEACSGLRMLIAFVIAAALIAYLVKRPRWQKAVLLASSIPVAVICNVIRIFATALLMLYVNSEVGQKFFHDIGGFVMIAVAVSLLFGEIRLMDRLFVSESNTQAEHVIVSRRASVRGRAKGARNHA
jgi:exosortase